MDWLESLSFFRYLGVRVFPEGTGSPNSAGIDFYKRLVDELHRSGIEPFCTLFHWDLPQALQNIGGWENRDVAMAFAEYAGYVARILGDRVENFITLNEIRSFIEFGYGVGRYAPGLRLDSPRLQQARHHALLAHGLGVIAIRQEGQSTVRVGIAENIIAATPVIEDPKHIKAARYAMREENAPYLTAIMEGVYTDTFLSRLGKAVPNILCDDMRIISSKVDFVGLNIYQPTFVRADDTANGYAQVSLPASFPHMKSKWLAVGPEVLYWAPKLISEIWDINDIYITENGASCDDVLNGAGNVEDIDRVSFLRNYISQLHRSIKDGAPVRGYFLWSLLDNFEWEAGYEARFGLIFVDYRTKKRYPKMSAHFYKEVIRQNAVV